MVFTVEMIQQTGRSTHLMAVYQMEKVVYFILMMGGKIALMGQHPVVVHRGVAEVRPDRIHAVGFDRRRQRLGGQIKRFGPLNFNVLVLTRRRSNALQGLA